MKVKNGAKSAKLKVKRLRQTQTVASCCLRHDQEQQKLAVGQTDINCRRQRTIGKPCGHHLMRPCAHTHTQLIAHLIEHCVECAHCAVCTTCRGLLLPKGIHGKKGKSNQKNSISHYLSCEKGFSRCFLSVAAAHAAAWSSKEQRKEHYLLLQIEATCKGLP